MTGTLGDAAVDALVASLWSTPGDDVYAVLDTARDPVIHRWVHRAAMDFTCLYRGPIAPALARVAPYLVHLYRGERFTRELLARGWARSWGIFVSGKQPMESLRMHFRRFLRVHDERGRRLLFRFYDPRVMRAYLPTCTALERRFILGGIGTLCLEDEHGAVLRFTEPEKPVGSRLVIRNAQMRALRAPFLRRWLGDADAHARRCHPDEAAMLGDARFAAHLDAAIARAAEYDLASRRDLLRYVSLTLIFGLEWERGSDTRWMHDALAGDHVRGDGSARLHALYRDVLGRLARGEMPQTEYA